LQFVRYPIVLRQRFAGAFDMAQSDTLILRVEPETEKSIYRDIEVEGSQTLYKLAEVILAAFEFDFDHAFGFYSGLTPTKMLSMNPRYELFADMGDAAPGVLGVKKTKIGHAFPAVGAYDDIPLRLWG
jgi:hypothetical protein